jgi:hypothetical protein
MVGEKEYHVTHWPNEDEPYVDEILQAD